MLLKKMIRSSLGLGALLCAVGAAPPAGRPQWPAAPSPARLQYADEVRSPLASEPRGGKSAGAWLRLLLGIESATQRARQEGLIQPTGLYARAGILYVADAARGAVLRYDLAKGKGEWLPKGRALRLVSPVGVASSADGRVYILDSFLKKVFILDPQGKPVGELAGDPQGLGRPAGLTLSDNRVYVSDVLNHRIGVYGLEGVFIHSFGQRGEAAGMLNYPTYLWFDARRRRLWATDSGNFRLQWFDPDGRLLGTFGEQGNRPGYLARPRGVAQDSDGHVYVADAAFDALQVFDPEGRLLLFAGMSGGEPGQFNLPGGVFIDEKDRVFVADTQNGRVQIFQYFKEGSR